MFIAGIVFASLSIVVSMFEIVFAYLENEYWRKLLKPFCTLFLGLAAVFFLPNHFLVYLGVFLGVIGDIFLISKKNKKSFKIGTIAFLFGHLCYVSEMLFVLMSNSVEWYFYAITGFATLVFIIGAYPMSSKLTGHNKFLTLLGNAYISSLLLTTVASIFACANGFFNYMFLVTIGGISFLISDLILVYVRFKKDIRRRDYYVMLFYLLGQCLIVLGFVLTYTYGK
jgi:uncharacterized membrane protein YhhN